MALFVSSFPLAGPTRNNTYLRTYVYILSCRLIVPYLLARKQAAMVWQTLFGRGDIGPTSATLAPGAPPLA